MKKLIIIAAALFCFCSATTTNAQVSVHFNIGLQPIWGPVGYDYVDYYYIPDIDAYYDVNNEQYVYFDNGRWIPTRVLPPRYHGFDFYNAHKVVINEPTPWLHNDRYRTQYSQYRGHHDQQVIRDSHEQKYWENPGHPEHSKWHGNPGHDNRGHENHGHENHGHENHGHSR